MATVRGVYGGVGSGESGSVGIAEPSAHAALVRHLSHTLLRGVFLQGLARASLELVKKAADDMDVDTGMGSGARRRWMQSARSPLQARAAPHVQPAPVRRPFLQTSKIRRRREIRHICAPPPTDDAAVRAEHYGIDENLPQSVRPQVHWAFLYWGVAPEFDISDEAQVAHSGILAVAKAAVWVLLNPLRTPSLYATSVTHYREVCSYRAWLGRAWN